MLYQITAPHFCAGIVLEGSVTRAAPILAYMRGWGLNKVQAYCQKKGWRVIEAHPLSE